MNLALTRLYGRAAPGVRVVDRVPQNYGENLSLLAALSSAGVSAPMTVNGAVDTAVFRAWVEQVLGRRPLSRAISSCGTTWQCTRRQALPRPSLPGERGWSHFPRILPISTRLSSAGPSSKPLCAWPAPAPATGSTRRSSELYRRSLRPMRRYGSLIVVILCIHR